MSWNMLQHVIYDSDFVLQVPTEQWANAAPEIPAGQVGQQGF